jgi:nucleoside-diphosphate-sugar epimerase
VNILVTGGTGFVGRHLVDRLAAAGHRVVSYNRDFTARAADGVRAVQGEPSGTAWRSTSTGYETDWGERHAAHRRAPAHVSQARGWQALEDGL